ncbi:MAG: glycosyltransferase family 4 protein [Anaerolineales bacterium]|nr:glycosyltransferase family 4 protein [Anaerolineales bacterium]
MSRLELRKAGLQQRVLPTYRIPFVETFAKACPSGLSVFTGQPQSGEMITRVVQLQGARLVNTTNYHFRDPASKFYLCWQTGILKWLNEWQPDILIVEANPRYLSTRQAIRWMHQRQRPVIGWGLGAPTLVGMLAPLRKAQRRSFIHSLDALIAYSQRGKQEYENLGIDPERIFVAPNATALKPTNPPKERPLSYQAKPNVLFIGRLQARKKIDNLLYACAQLPETLQPHVVIIGEGPARQSWEILAQAIYPNAEFTGARHGAELDPYFEQADLFVLPGTGGLAVQQAMAYGLPVIAAQGDGTQDDLVHLATEQREGNGWIVPPDDIPALTDALQAALSDVPDLRRKGQESYRIVESEANVEQMADVFVEAIQTITGNARYHRIKD